MTDRELVESVWENVVEMRSEIAFWRHRAPSWAAAAEFTRNRKKDIAEIDVEMTIIAGEIADAVDNDRPSYEAAFRRILSRLESIRTDLKRGMKA